MSKLGNTWTSICTHGNRVSWGCTGCTGCKNCSYVLSNHYFFVFTHNEDNKEMKKICHLTKYQHFVGWSTEKHTSLQHLSDIDLAARIHTYDLQAWLLHLIVLKNEKHISWKNSCCYKKQLPVCLATQVTMNTLSWHAGCCANSPMISESRWRSLPRFSKLSVGLALGTWETAIPSAAMTFSDSYVPPEQWNCQPREEAQQCRRPNLTEAKSRWEHYHSEEKEMTKSHQLQFSDL